MSAPQPPDWLGRIRSAFDADPPKWFRDFVPPPGPARQSAVLMLFGARTGPLGQTSAVDVVLTERTPHLRSHAGQVSLPGGRIDPGDDGPIGAALRETHEEVGIEAHDISVVDTLDPLFLFPSQNAVTPVLGWWLRPTPLEVINPFEVARVARADIDELRDPANRFTVVGPSGYRGPGFEVEGLFVWGFTAMLLSEVLGLAGLTRPWDDQVERPLPAVQLERIWRGRS
ncbi:NUDIX hydrolase [Kribbia dieselivorans]|uniref:NUDIX hydrolase n=1 Tax=Kribbia dieselivorans TaxID=331526 RepID=UPI0008391631|nr:CoA pyrophosphatase [Kribbia dieselivorans]